ncbi:hypothetical protein [Thalassospira xiamenensis]|uniref:Uncharacterized protein n=1 Tax=Thalassospira xiamenensis TaxID=220697 RepID=A0A285TXA9_9PROT|nr:hypothetical protein [Thalassospira xiamenensis]SOC30390.1 hypothetical protein SAMN05428964_10927 [Thalassospira xiamenensis]
MSDAMIVGAAMNQALVAAENSRDAWKKEAKDWEKIAKDAIATMKEKDMIVSGMNAIITAFKEMHPNSPLLSGSQQKYADGTEKTIARIKYEKAFDLRGRELGIENPEKHRKN